MRARILQLTVLALVLCPPISYGLPMQIIVSQDEIPDSADYICTDGDPCDDPDGVWDQSVGFFRPGVVHVATAAEFNPGISGITSLSARSAGIDLLRDPPMPRFGWSSMGTNADVEFSDASAVSIFVTSQYRLEHDSVIGILPRHGLQIEQGTTQGMFVQGTTNVYMGYHPFDFDSLLFSDSVSVDIPPGEQKEWWQRGIAWNHFAIDLSPYTPDSTYYLTMMLTVESSGPGRVLYGSGLDIPEPSTLALFGLGLLVLGFARRRA